ncbi:phosphorylated CTD interacting factor [Pelomyxa schiedti]|nr:phosphorylated CTD interacting factor [Pelomyxa schiedti]
MSDTQATVPEVVSTTTASVVVSDLNPAIPVPSTTTTTTTTSGAAAPTSPVTANTPRRVVNLRGVKKSPTSAPLNSSSPSPSAAATAAAEAAADSPAQQRQHKLSPPVASPTLRVTSPGAGASRPRMIPTSTRSPATTTTPASGAANQGDLCWNDTNTAEAARVGPPDDTTGLPIWRFDWPCGFAKRIEGAECSSKEAAAESTGMPPPEIEGNPAPQPSAQGETAAAEQAPPSTDLTAKKHVKTSTDYGEILGISAPDESFNRWLYDQLACAGASSQTGLLKNPSVAQKTLVLHEQLLENFPSSVYVSCCKEWLQHAAQDYKAAGIQELASFKTDIVTIHEVLDGATQFSKYGPEEDDEEHIYELMKIEAKKVSDALAPVVKPLIDYLVDRLLHSTNKVICRLSGAVEPHKLGVRIKKQSAQYYHVVYRDDTIRLTNIHFDKLRALYFTNSRCLWDKFPYSLYTILRRYTTFFGSSTRVTAKQREGTTFHAAAPETVFTFLHNTFGVSYECFASPLNCFFPQFCSAFYDVDWVFGSQGSFFDWEPPQQGGVFEVGPPYTLGVMNMCAKRLLELISQSDKSNATDTIGTTTSTTESSNQLPAPKQPLTFFVFVPEWRTPPAEYHLTLEAAPCLRHTFAAEGKKHSYVVGDQHDRFARHFVLPFSTRVYVLQNNEAWARTPFSAENGQQLTEQLVNAHGEESAEPPHPKKSRFSF